MPEALVVRGDRILVPPARPLLFTPSHPLQSRGGPGGWRPTGGSIASEPAGKGIKMLVGFYPVWCLAP